MLISVQLTHEGNGNASISTKILDMKEGGRIVFWELNCKTKE